MTDWISLVDKGMVQTRPASAGFFAIYLLYLFPGLDFLPVARAAIALSGQILPSQSVTSLTSLRVPDGKLTIL
jgi:hypothetical protein